MHKKFDHKAIEKKWQAKWNQENIYRSTESDKPKSFILDMFPYPSGEGLHVGHPKGYIATDIYSRFKRMTGHEVLHPMGWDAFGLPAENFAIKNKVHPRAAVDKNVAHFKKQLSLLGFDYDWDREINTTDPEFYKWTQWIFIQLWKKGLAYESHEPINWCPGCQTGLANEDLEPDGTCERCDSVVEKRPMRQWVLKIREYADRMLEDLDTLKWPEHIKEAQRNWIGRSAGAEIDFKLSTGDIVTVFTTRPDTLFGVTYMVLAPEHTLLQTEQVRDKVTNLEEVDKYIKESANKKEMDRLDDTKEKTGVKIEGLTAINPANGEEIPVYIADYVLAGYGTGAIMAVPAHDDRDFEFAKKYDIEIRHVIYRDYMGGCVLAWAKQNNISYQSEDELVKTLAEKIKSNETIYVGRGKLINSGEFDGMSSTEAKEAIVEKVGGRMTNTYKIKDWVFSRQRYWGEPFPIVHTKEGKVYPIAVEQLPVKLPEVDNYEPTGDGRSPLANIDEWVNVTGYVTDEEDFIVAEQAPDGKELIKATRETNTMPQWAGSSWYYLRFMDPHNEDALVSKEKEKYWAPVDVYVGGDHAVRHLIYARFWHKFLYDISVVSTTEPFQRLEFLGFILAEDGRKMSKRWGNVINPDDIVDLVGADTLRIYEMFMGPFENTIAWSKDGLAGARRFLEKVNGLSEHIVESEPATVTNQLHKTIKKVAEDIEGFKFNTAISAMMIFVNLAEKEGLEKESYQIFLRLLAPFAPHLTDELWTLAGNANSIHIAEFPTFDESLAVDETVTIGVQINGKVRGEITVSPEASEDEVMEAVKENQQLVERLAAGEVKKIIYKPGKILNLIV